MNASPLRVLIVDDETLACLRLRTLLESRDEDFQIEEAGDGISALEKIEQFKPGLVFLDIQMPELDGFDVLNAVPSPDFAVIFQTAFDEYAVRAFEVNACDYLLKPWSDARFHQAVDRVLTGPESLAGKAPLREMMQITVNAGQTSRIFSVEEVNYFFSQDHVTTMHLDGVDYSVDYSLSHLEERLDPARFLRIHRNAIINLEKLTMYTRGPRAEVGLACGTRLRVSRERRRQLVAMLEN